MIQIDNQGATTAKTLPLGPGNPLTPPAGAGTFLVFMGQTAPPLPPTPVVVAVGMTALPSGMAVQLPPQFSAQLPPIITNQPSADLPTAAAGSRPVLLATQPPLPLVNAPRIVPAQTGDDPENKADTSTVIPSEIILTPNVPVAAPALPPITQSENGPPNVTGATPLNGPSASVLNAPEPLSKPTEPPTPQSAANPAQPSTLPDTIAPQTRLSAQPMPAPIPPVSPLQTGLQVAPSAPLPLTNTDQTAGPYDPVTPFNAENRQPLAKPALPAAAPAPQPTAPQPTAPHSMSPTPPLNIAAGAESPNPKQPQRAAPPLEISVTPGTNIGLPPTLGTIAVAQPSITPPPQPGLHTIPLGPVAPLTQSPEQPAPTMPERASNPMPDPRALAFAGALSAYKATESHPATAITQTPFAQVPLAALTQSVSFAQPTQRPLTQTHIAPRVAVQTDALHTTQTPLPTSPIVPAPVIPTPITPIASAPVIPATATPPAPFTLHPPVKSGQPLPPAPIPTPPTETAKPVIPDRPAFAEAIPTTSHATTSTPAQTTTITLQNPVPLPALVQHIRQHATSGKPTTLELSLAPEELGKLRLLMTPDGDKLRIIIQAERPETLELLRRNSDSFTADLRQSGFAGASFSFSGWGDQPSAQRSKPQDATTQPFGTNSEIIPTAKPYVRSQNPSGLDLRV